MTRLRLPLIRYLFDTNACIALLNNASPPLQARLCRFAPVDVGLPAPVAYELYYGAYKSRDADRNLDLLDRSAFEIVPFDVGDARVAGAVRSELEAEGKPIGPYDLMIAGQACARNLVLITANSREFERVEGRRAGPPFAFCRERPAGDGEDPSRRNGRRTGPPTRDARETLLPLMPRAGCSRAPTSGGRFSRAAATGWCSVRLDRSGSTAGNAPHPRRGPHLHDPLRRPART